jgi:hypothetical protein
MYGGVQEYRTGLVLTISLLQQWRDKLILGKYLRNVAIINAISFRGLGASFGKLKKYIPMILKQYKNSAGGVYATVGYDEKNKCVYDTWEGMFGSQENFKTVLLYITQVIEERKAVCWLADLSKMSGSFDGSKEWIISTIMPKVVRAGLMYEAIVLPKNVFSKLSTKDTVTKINNFEIRQFDDVEKAKAWLNSMAHSMVS